jgi:hypothetical protein
MVVMGVKDRSLAVPSMVVMGVKDRSLAVPSMVVMGSTAGLLLVCPPFLPPNSRTQGLGAVCGMVCW